MVIEEKSFNFSSDEEDTKETNVYKLLVDVFESSIHETDLTNLLKELCILYDSFSNEGFESGFKMLLVETLTINKRSKDIRKVFRFISDFAVTLDNKYKADNAKLKKNKEAQEENEDDGDPMHPFLEYLFRILIEGINASSYVIRYRSCQLLYAVLTNIQDNGVGEIDMVTYELIAGTIQKRRLDVSCTVRAHAVLLAKFFQDPSTHDDPVISGLCWQMQFDPNPRVRQNIVDIVAACEESIIPVTKRFLFDKSAQVRNSALLHICHRVSPRSFTVAQRINILAHCFSDPAAQVRRNAEQKLIPMWFRAYKDKICDFVRQLRLGVDVLDSLPFMESLLNVLYKSIKVSQIIDEIELNMEIFLPKLPLSGEKVYLWRNFYLMAIKEEKLKKYIPETENLIEFILKVCNSSVVDADTSCVFNELIWFAMDIVELEGTEKCEKLLSLPLTVMKNPFLPQEVIPYAALFYSKNAKDCGQIGKDLLQIVEEFQTMVQFLSEEEAKELALKCLTIVSGTLIQENITINKETFYSIKNQLIHPYLSSNDKDLKRGAFSALCSYCLSDISEAKKSWPLIMDGIKSSSSTLKFSLLKEAFNILKRHGRDLFGNPASEDGNEFDNILDDILSLMGGGDREKLIFFSGILKLYADHHTASVVILAKLFFYVYKNGWNLGKCYIGKFVQLYGQSRPEAECLTGAFLTLINLLCPSNRTYSSNINMKAIILQLLEFSKMYEESKAFTVEEKFQDLLILKLTKKFIKSPWMLPAKDLHYICDHIIPTNIDVLAKLKENVKQIIECLQSAKFEEKSSYTKGSIKFFSNYLKKITAAINSGSNLNENNIASSNKGTKTPGKKNKITTSSNILEATATPTISRSEDIEGIETPTTNRTSDIERTDTPASLMLEEFNQKDSATQNETSACEE